MITVPETAVSYSAYGNSVVVNPAQEGKGLTVRQAKTAERMQGRVVVSEGLQAGDRVVTSGRLRLHNGVELSEQARAAGRDYRAGDRRHYSAYGNSVVVNPAQEGGLTVRQAYGQDRRAHAGPRGRQRRLQAGDRVVTSGLRLHNGAAVELSDTGADAAGRPRPWLRLQ